MFAVEDENPAGKQKEQRNERSNMGTVEPVMLEMCNRYQEKSVTCGYMITDYIPAEV